MVSYKDGFASLVRNLKRFHDDAVISSFRIIALFTDGHTSADRVIQKDWLDETQTVISIAHRTRVNLSGRHAHADGKDQSAVSNALFERLRAAPLSVHMMRVKIARLTGVQDDIGFSDCSSGGLSCIPSNVVFEEQFSHRFLPELIPRCGMIRLTAQAFRNHPMSHMNKLLQNVALSGITWDHTRGLLPMQATAQLFYEQTGAVIEWHKRSLQSFADAPLAKLASEFDLLVIDHPSIGEAAHLDLLLPLDQWLSAEFLADQAAHTVGGSNASYFYGGHQYALAIDAATPVSGWRADLMEHADASLPQTWEELLALGRRGLIAVPAIPIDSLMNLFMIANALGAEPFSKEDRVIADPERGEEALERLRELVMLSAPGSLERNPIRTWQLLCENDKVAYCPFAYGYSNYARRGYPAHRLRFGGLVKMGGRTLRSTLGGAGLAISRQSRHPEAAITYAQFVTFAEMQSTVYTLAGGQPGHRTAWLDPDLNQITNHYFHDTLSTLDGAWVRPRFPGFIAFQDEASTLVHAFLRDGGNASQTLQAMDESLARHRSKGAQA